MISDDELVNYLLAFPDKSLGELASSIGLPERSLQYRISLPGFAAKLAASRKSSICDAAVYGSAGLVECLEVLQKEMRSESNFSGERVRAAEVFSKIAFKANEEAVTRFELLRLRSYIEQKEHERQTASKPVTFDVGDEPPPDDTDPPAEKSHTVTQAGRSSTGEGDSTGAADRPTEANVGEKLVMSESVAAKFQMIIAKNTNKE